MSIQLYRSPKLGETQIRFTIDDHAAEGVVSVVGSFNGWTPGINVFVLRADGTRVADVTVRTEEDVHFRYLGSGGFWFDDPDADEINEGGSVLYLGAEDRDGPDGVFRPIPDWASIAAQR
jgi:hypothetical protein